MDSSKQNQTKHTHSPMNSMQTDAVPELWLGHPCSTDENLDKKACTIVKLPEDTSAAWCSPSALVSSEDAVTC